VTEFTGSQLMAREERNQYRNQVRAAKTAKERGVTLPDEPPARGRLMGPGGVMGPGSGNR